MRWIIHFFETQRVKNMESRYLLIVFLFAWKPDCLVQSAWCDNVKYSENRIDSNEYINNCIPKSWQPFFKRLKKIYYDDTDISLLGDLADNLMDIGKQLDNAIEPQMPLLFRALELVDPEDVKVVILGQDPTPQKDKATGVAFHVKEPRFVPAVLHIFLEVAFEGFPVDLNNGDVTNWARQGVLLLNAALTCPHNPPKGKAKYKSHSDIWRDFTEYLIGHICDSADPSVWLLWGETAKSFSKHIKEKHLIIQGGHPSPKGTAIYGDSFFGNNYFNIANQFLEINDRVAIDWSLSGTGRNGLEFGLCHQTENEVMQRQIEEQQLRNEQQQIQHFIDSIEQKIKEMQHELEKTNLELQKTERDLSSNLWPQNPQGIIHLKKLEEKYDEELKHINQLHRKIKDLKYQQSRIKEKIQQNRKNQQYLRGLPKDLLKRNFQKQINVIDEELNQLR